MSSVLEILDRFPAGGDEEDKRAWRGELERSLTTAAGEWVRAAGPPGSEQLTKDRAWVLLSWVEGAASDVVRTRRGELVEIAAFAMSLLEAGPLDRRDVMVVATLVRRASAITALPFATLARRGCERAGELGVACQAWLLKIGDATPPGRAASPRGGVWPVTVIAVLVATGLIAAIILLYDRGWLSLTGPFVAAILGPTVIVLVLAWRTRRERRLSEAAVDQLQELMADIARERELAPDLRPTRGSDQSLTHAAEQVELALQRFAWGQEQVAARFVDALAATAQESWRPGAPLSEAVHRLARTIERLSRRRSNTVDGA